MMVETLKSVKIHIVVNTIKTFNFYQNFTFMGPFIRSKIQKIISYVKNSLNTNNSGTKNSSIVMYSCGSSIIWPGWQFFVRRLKIKKKKKKKPF